MSFFNDKDKIYLNKNVKLKNGGRKAIRMTVAEFNDILSKLKKKIGDEDYDTESENNYDWILYEAIEALPKLQKDLSKISFDFENYEIDPNVHLTIFGVPYLRCFAGGDWEIPIRFFIYFDGKDLRGYIPTKGNTFNRKTKEALGNGLNDTKDSDYCFIVNDVCPELMKQYGQDKINKIMKDDFDLNLVEFQEDWCLEDFESRLEIRLTFEEIENKSDELFEKLTNLLSEKGFTFEETDMVCEDYDREFVFVCKDNKSLSNFFENERHALLYSYGSKEDECPSYLMIDPNGNQISVIESENPAVVLDWMEKHLDELANRLCDFYIFNTEN